MIIIIFAQRNLIMFSIKIIFSLTSCFYQIDKNNTKFGFKLDKDSGISGVASSKRKFLKVGTKRSPDKRISIINNKGNINKISKKNDKNAIKLGLAIFSTNQELVDKVGGFGNIET